MAKLKTIKNLEAIIDSLEDSKLDCSNDLDETESIIDKIITFQCTYKQLTGRYYSKDDEKRKPYTHRS